MISSRNSKFMQICWNPSFFSSFLGFRSVLASTMLPSPLLFPIGNRSSSLFVRTLINLNPCPYTCTPPNHDPHVRCSRGLRSLRPSLLYVFICYPSYPRFELFSSTFSILVSSIPSIITDSRTHTHSLHRYAIPIIDTLLRFSMYVCSNI